MNHTFKLIASRGTEILFDGRIDAPTPREARKRLKDQLGLTSLSGIVYSITEIPVDLIREIVDARIAELTGHQPDPVEELPAEPDWSLVRRHYLRYGDPARTAAKYGIEPDVLNARATTEGWAA